MKFDEMNPAPPVTRMRLRTGADSTGAPPAPRGCASRPAVARDIVRSGTQGDHLEGRLGDDLLAGGEGNDSLDGQAGDDELVGQSGSDNLRGRAANDLLADGPGQDFLVGGPGGDAFLVDPTPLAEEDQFLGGSGRDSLDYGGVAGAPVSVDLTAGEASGLAHGIDILTSVENVIGTASGDTIIGNGGANELSGGPGDDHLEGLAGDDTLRGGEGVDFIDGGDGDDLCSLPELGETVQFCETFSARPG